MSNTSSYLHASRRGLSPTQPPTALYPVLELSPVIPLSKSLYSLFSFANSSVTTSAPSVPRGRVGAAR